MTTPNTPAMIEQFANDIREHLLFTRAKDLANATEVDLYQAVAHTVRDRLVRQWLHTKRTHATSQCRRVCYLSAEYLVGRQLGCNLLALGLVDTARAALAKLNVSLDAVLETERDPGLGNGGLGRLAACFMDSCATLDLPAIGYGIRYEFGIFRQEIADGWQAEHPDEWLRDGNPWEIARPEYAFEIGFGGAVHHTVDHHGHFRAHWVPNETVVGVPYDTPIVGYQTTTVNTLRLWSAQASEQFDLAVFNDGDYRLAIEGKAMSESISKVLYPRDDSVEGKRLRLRQQYFFATCSLRDVLRRLRRDVGDIKRLPDLIVLQLNDTHPAVAIPELMRLLLDEEQLGWAEAWDLTTRTIAYTNHTLLPEALERWSIELFASCLPRHLEILREIDRRFALDVHVASGGDRGVRERTAIVDDHVIHMARLSVVGSHHVNGVAGLHAELLREVVMPDFAKLYPRRFSGITNGVTPRRFLRHCNPLLSALLDELVTPGWTRDLTLLAGLVRHTDDASVHERLRAIKLANKRALAAHLQQRDGISLDASSLFDVHVKRIHEYKRQLMAMLHVVHRYARMRFHGADLAPRTVIIGGKAAPGYARAKQIIKVVHDVAAIVNNDPFTRDRLQLHFVPDYDVSLAELIIPATDLSEQISMAGKEASGTGNMKFQMNGALTIGTLDGANVEIRDAVGADHFFLFGLDAPQAATWRQSGRSPGAAIAASPDLMEAIALITDGYFAPEDPSLHREVANYLRHEDPYLVCADFDAYLLAQSEVDARAARPDAWASSVMHNLAGAGYFTSDRSIQDYNRNIWRLTPVQVQLPKG